MRRLFYFLLCLFCFSMYAQVGINTTNPNAVLEVRASSTTTPSNTDGLLMPKIDHFPVTNPTASQDGMMVYVTGNGTPTKGFYNWDQGTTSWIAITGSNVQRLNDLLDAKSDNDGTNDGSSVFIGLTSGNVDDSNDNRNTGIGYGVLSSNTTGNLNSAVGYRSLASNINGQGNAVLGNYAMQANTSGTNNVSIGISSLFSNTTGNANIGIGFSALHTNTTGSENIAIGINALRMNSSGTYNVALGIGSIFHNTSGTQNVAIGYASLNFNTTGNYNTAVGSSALNKNITGSSNTALGNLSLFNNTTGLSNTALGNIALRNNSTGIGNNAIGLSSLSANTTGNNNIGIGVNAGSLMQTNGAIIPNNNIIIGSNIQLPNNNGSNQLNIGNIIYGNNVDGIGYSLSSGNIGIGVSNPLDKLHIGGSLRIVDGSEGAGKILQSDANGSTSWVNPSAPSEWIDNGTFLSPLDGSNEDITIGGADDVEARLTVRSDKPISGLFTNSTVQNNYMYGVKTDLTNMSTSSSSFTIGSFNDITNNGLGTTYGSFNDIKGTSHGEMVGLNNILSSNGNGTHLGTNNSLQGSGTGNKYGCYNSIQTIAGGTHYGVYSNVLKPDGYAGYFEGRVSIGNGSGLNNYILPLSRGTNSQIMQTDGTGNVNWVHSYSPVWYNEATTTNATNTTSDIIRQGNIGLGVTNVNHSLDIYDGIGETSINILIDNGSGSSNDSSYAIKSNLNGTNGSLSTGPLIGTENTITAAGLAIGVNNLVTGNLASGGDTYGIYNSVTHNGSGNAYGTYNLINNSITSSGNQYGSYNLVNGPGTGVYSQATAVGAIAGYFLGTVSIGSNTTNTYNLPQSRGANEQIMQTDGSGNVTWVNTNNISWNLTGNNGTNPSTNFIGSIDNADLSFRTNNIERMRINTLGDIEIIASSGKAILKTDDNFNHFLDNNIDLGDEVDAWMLSSQHGTNENSGIYGDRDFVTIWAPADSGRIIRFLDEDNWSDNDGNPYNNSAELAYIDNSGQYFQASDKHRKEHIEKITNPLDKLQSINGYTYTFKLNPEEIKKGETPNKTSGVLAQELYKVFPEAVQINENGEYFVNYAGILPMLIEGIKDQQQEIKALKKEISELKTLEQRIQIIEERLN